MSDRDGKGSISPLSQIQRKGYAEKYRADGRKIISIGILFNPTTRNIEQWDVISD